MTNKTIMKELKDDEYNNILETTIVWNCKSSNYGLVPSLLAKNSVL